MIGHFSEISARGLSNMIPAQEDLDGKIRMVQIGLLVNSKVPSKPDFLKTRYFFINLGFLEIDVPQKIRNRKKAKSVSFFASTA